MSDELVPLDPEQGVERFLSHKRPSWRESTVYNAETRTRVFLDWCEEAEIENLNELSGRDLDAWVRWRQKQIKPISLQKQLSTIREALRYWEMIEAVEDGLAEKLHAPELPDGAEAKDEHITTERAEAILENLDRYWFGSRRHVVFALLWRTGMRRGALRAIDVDDLDEEEHAIELRHRPETDTQLKNGERGERDVYLGPRWFGIVEGYLNNPERPDVTDDHGRQPLITTVHGRASENTLYTTVHKATQPCHYGDCPHDRDPDDCEAIGAANVPSKCPSSVSPHSIRRGRITHDLNHGRPPEAITKRADVSLGVLEKHYDARSKREKMDVRKQFFEEGSS
jgi:site-specific recombinase XerD